MSSNRAQAEAILQIENDRVIITQWRFPPGAETGWHKHGYDYMVIPGLNGQLLLETIAGNNIAELEAGQSYYRQAGVEHNVVNVNDYPFSFVEIELK